MEEKILKNKMEKEEITNDFKMEKEETCNNYPLVDETFFPDLEIIQKLDAEIEAIGSKMWKEYKEKDLLKDLK
jgi:hypothetical protein